MRLSVRHVLIPAAPLSLLLCQNGVRDPFDPAHVAAMRDSVRDMAAAIARDLERDGPTAWLTYFLDDPGFFMASDGSVVFPSLDSATSFVRGFAPGIDRMELVWGDMRIDPLAPGSAILGASYDEVLTDTSGVESRFRGYFTGLAVHAPEGWRLRHMHWSSPASETP